jgi:hypothetical protein
MRRSSVIKVVAAAAVGAVVVAFAARILAMTAFGFWIGVIMGALILPTFVLIYLGLLRWAAGTFFFFTVFALIAEGVLAGPVAALMGATCMLAGAILTFLFSARILKNLYGGDELEALAHHLQLAVGRIHGVQKIENGQIVVPKGQERMIGPTQIRIEPYNAAVVMSIHQGNKEASPQQQGHDQTRPRYTTDVFGPGNYITRPLDYVAAVYDLREKQQEFLFQGVRTQDGKIVNTQLSVRYSLDIRDDAKEGHGSLSEDEQRIVYSLAVSRIDWEAAMKSALESSVRQVIGATLAPAILTGQQFDWYEERIAGLANQRLHRRGVSVLQVVIENAHEQS